MESQPGEEFAFWLSVGEPDLLHLELRVGAMELHRIGRGRGVGSGVVQVPYDGVFSVRDQLDLLDPSPKAHKLAQLNHCANAAIPRIQLFRSISFCTDLFFLVAILKRQASHASDAHGRSNYRARIKPSAHFRR